MKSLMAAFAVVTAGCPAVWAMPAEVVSTFGGFEHICALDSINGGVLITVYKGGTSEQLWFSNGYAGGTEFVAEVSPRDHTINLSPVTRICAGDAVYFNAVPNQVWKSDGTPHGTYVLVQDFFFQSFFNAAGVAYFSGYTAGDVPNSIWRSDGTVAGTYKLIDPPRPFDYYKSGVVVDGILYFSCPDETHTMELYRSDGTIPGTFKVKELTAGGTMGTAPYIGVIGSNLYFFVNESSDKPDRLYRSDGTAGGTEMIYEFNEYPLEVPYWTPIGNSLLFFANDGLHGHEPWVTDGTPGGTRLVKDICPGTDSCAPAQPLLIDNTAFFMANDGVHGRQLWKSDGSAEGTQMVFVLPPEASPDPRYARTYGAAGGRVYFGWKDSEFEPYHLYSTTGTEAGTRPFGLFDLWQFCEAGPYESWPEFTFIEACGQCFFGRACELCKVTETGWEIVTLDNGALADTARVYPKPVLLHDRLIVAGDHALWAIDVASGFRFSRQPTPQWAEEGGSFQLEVTLAGASGEAACQWFKDGQELDGETGRVYRADYVTHQDAGWYTCRATDESKASIETAPVQVQVFQTGTLPAAGILAMIALTTACAIGAAHSIMRRKR